METHTATLRYPGRVHIVVLVLPKRGGGFCADLLVAHPMARVGCGESEPERWRWPTLAN